MTRVRIALLNAAHERAENRRNFRREIDADLVEFPVAEGQIPETFDFDGAIVTGSRASVYWDESWIVELKEWVGDAIERDMPFLGVCYGHQLLADVLGGQVEAMDEYEIGYREVRQTGDADSPLFDGLDEEFTVFTTHSDRVSRLPPGATLIAENDYGIHGFRKGDVFSVQFHPEYDMKTAKLVTRDKDDQLDGATLRTALNGITDENYAAACEAKVLFENFVEYVRESVDPGDGATTSASSD